MHSGRRTRLANAAGPFVLCRSHLSTRAIARTVARLAEFTELLKPEHDRRFWPRGPASILLPPPSIGSASWPNARRAMRRCALANTLATVAALATLIACSARRRALQSRERRHGGRGTLAWSDVAAYAGVQIRLLRRDPLHAGSMPLLQYHRRLLGPIAMARRIIGPAADRHYRRHPRGIPCGLDGCPWIGAGTGSPPDFVANRRSRLPGDVDTFTASSRRVPHSCWRSPLGSLAGFAGSRFLFPAGRRLP